MKKIFAAIGLLLLLQNAWAIDLHDAKAQGLVGEARTGYLAAVTTLASSEVKTAAGHYYQDKNGRWKKK